MMTTPLLFLAVFGVWAALSLGITTLFHLIEKYRWKKAWAAYHANHPEG